MIGLLVFVFILILGICLHRKAIAVEKASMSPEDYEKFRMYASAYGPGAPTNVWMIGSTFCYVISYFLLAVLIRHL